ncbi:MAG TPA: toprim domain-containing protein [Candidatus Nitrosocosmicus sp.]|jgi:5S rRNA maturation endonuclease (ribonuclease M5)|nr:toprim domain-containing protein [Candidatus Nitrosocosmicus sp.]
MDKTQRLEKIRELREFVNQINNESAKDSLILVEGKRDLEALSYLGCSGNIQIYHNYKSIVDLTDNFRDKYKKLILLLDLDDTGKYMTRKISHILNQRYIDNYYRNKIIKITQGKIRTIEELRSFYNSML